MTAPILRDYQRRDLERLRASFRAGRHAVLYQAPTGSGKTVLFAEIVRGAMRRGSRVWIVVHRQELVDQCSRALTALDIPHGIVAAGRMQASTHKVLVCSVQSLARRLHRRDLAKVDLIVVDEAHHAVAGTWAKVLEHRNRARVLGVTATPSRLDGRGLGRDVGGRFEELVQGPAVDDLTQQGYLAPARVYIPPQVADLDGVATRAGDYAVGDAASRLDEPTVTGDAIDHYERICPGAPAIAFCTRVQHAEHVAEQFRARGWSAESIDGSLSDRMRRDRIAALADGRLHVLTSCEIVSEGTDIPVVTAAILLRPTKSLGVHLQQVGRVLRPAPGKQAAIILDHVGNCTRLGFPDEDREWSLYGPPKRPKAESVAIRTCPRCFASFSPRPTCPECGFTFQSAPREIDQVDGELVEATQADKEQAKQQRKRQQGRAKTREALELYAAQRGYKPGWVDHILRSRGYSVCPQCEIRHGVEGCREQGLAV